MTLRGGRGTREITEIFKRISDTPVDQQLTLRLATGRYIGEGFDEPRLDTLFLTMPIFVEGDSAAICGEASSTVCRKKRGPDLRLCRYPCKHAGEDVP